MSSANTDRKYYVKIPSNNIHTGHLRVTSYQLGIESLKAQVEIQNCDFKSTSYAMVEWLPQQQMFHSILPVFFLLSSCETKITVFLAQLD